jgi:integrase
MIEKRLSGNQTAYYWNAPTLYVNAGFTLSREPLGGNYSRAVERAVELNQHLDAWREGRGGVKDLDLQPGFGTLGWLVERYKRSRAWEKVSARSRPEYERAFKLVLEFKLTTGQDLRFAPITAISAKGVDKLYTALQRSERVGRRLRQANVCMLRMGRAWDATHRLYPKTIPVENPFRGVEMEHGKATTKPATRTEAYALHRALVAAGEPHLAAVPLICFELHQRPENVLAGHLTWSDYRPPERPHSIRVEHHKTGEMVWLPLRDNSGDLFPELKAYLDSLERLGVPIVLMRPKAKDAPAKPFLFREARKRVRKAGGGGLTLAACRHGGLTELGDAELTEQGVMALSGHKDARSARLYVKRTDAQRLTAARKRRAWVDSTAQAEQKEGGFQNKAPAMVSE